MSGDVNYKSSINTDSPDWCANNQLPLAAFSNFPFFFLKMSFIDLAIWKDTKNILDSLGVLIFQISGETQVKVRSSRLKLFWKLCMRVLGKKKKKKKKNSLEVFSTNQPHCWKQTYIGEALKEKLSFTANPEFRILKTHKSVTCVSSENDEKYLQNAKSL